MNMSFNGSIKKLKDLNLEFEEEDEECESKSKIYV